MNEIAQIATLVIRLNNRLDAVEKRVAGKTGGELLWTDKDVALYLRCSPRTVANLPLPRLRLGTGTGASVRYVPSQVRQWAELRSGWEPREDK